MNTLAHQLGNHFKYFASEEANYESRGDKSACQAIHLAAGVGNCGAIVSLLNAGVDVNVQTRLLKKSKWENNYGPLHEACDFSQTEAVDLLCRMRADVNMHNYRGSAPLNTAAKRGNVAIIKLLLSYKADITETNRSGRRALAEAIDAGKLEHRYLFLLAQRSFDDLISVAKLCPAASSEIMKDKTGAVHPSWQEVISLGQGADRNYTLQWIHLMHLAPRTSRCQLPMCV